MNKHHSLVCNGGLVYHQNDSISSASKLSVHPGRVHLEGPLGVGGFAKVYKGSLTGYQGEVAIKVVRYHLQKYWRL